MTTAQPEMENHPNVQSILLNKTYKNETYTHTTSKGTLMEDRGTHLHSLKHLFCDGFPVQNAPA